MHRKLVALLLAGTLVLSGTLPAVSCAASPAMLNDSIAEEAADQSAPDEITDSFAAEEIGEISASAEEPERNVPETEEGLAWTSDLALGISRESDLMKEAGLSLDDWDQAIEDAKGEGLRNALTEAALKAEAPESEILKKEDQVYFIEGSHAFAPVQNALSAYRTLYQVMNLLGGTKDTDMRLWSQLTMKNLTVYSFQEIADSKEVMGSTVKIAVNEDGTVSAIFSGLDTETVNSSKLVTRAGAEEAVRRRLHEEGIQAKPLSDRTERIIYNPADMEFMLNLDLDPEPVPTEVLWVVYTENASGGEYPYTAHYTHLDGTYRFSLDVKEPGDEESESGYRKQQVFEGMIPDTWSGEICDLEGNVRIVTLPVMHSEKDGRWYLGDLERRIAVADYAEAAYGKEHRLDLVSTDTNNDWDNEDLYLYYNYIRAYDFYRRMGWNGPDGEGTDVIILKGMCASSGKLFANACSIGRVENWSMFGYTPYLKDGTPLGLMQALDVMIHEFTHTFTSTVMNNNLYENDLGAINEAMSDIFGNLGEYLYDDTGDTEWKLGENSGNVIRSMSRPHDYGQPEYVWDVFYGPHVDERSIMNDYGGVHSNSSLLNQIAALLCLDYGMSCEEAVPFWVTAAYGLTPAADYQEMEALLNWALTVSGNESYTEGLNNLIGEAHLSRTEIPDELPAGQKIIKLQLPDNDVFRDENWGMISCQVNRSALQSVAKAAIKIAWADASRDEEDYSAYRTILARAAKECELDIDESVFTEINSEEAAVEAIFRIMKGLNEKLLLQSLTWVENGTGEMVMVSEDNPTFYMLMNATESGTKVRRMVILIGKHWYDLGGMPEKTWNTEEDKMETTVRSLEKLAGFAGEVIKNTIADREEEGRDDESFPDFVSGVLKYIGGVLSEDESQLDEGIESAIDELLTVPAETEYLPTAGLEKVQLEG